MSKFGRKVNKVKRYLRRDFPEVYKHFSVEIKRCNNPRIGKWEFSCKYKNEHVFSWTFDDFTMVTTESFYDHVTNNFYRNYCTVVCRLKLKK